MRSARDMEERLAIMDGIKDGTRETERDTSMVKNKLQVSVVDNFLPSSKFLKFQKFATNLSMIPAYQGGHYGFRHDLDIDKYKNHHIAKTVKKTFFPVSNLIVDKVFIHLRHNPTEPRPHTDPPNFSFLFYLKGEPLFNNGTGFYVDGELGSHIGFKENRAIFFNCGEITHTHLQGFADSSPRYSMNIFYRGKIK